MQRLLQLLLSAIRLRKRLEGNIKEIGYRGSLVSRWLVGSRSSITTQLTSIDGTTNNNLSTKNNLSTEKKKQTKQKHMLRIKEFLKRFVIVRGVGPRLYVEFLTLKALYFPPSNKTCFSSKMF